MRKDLSMMLSLILAATIGLSACAEKKPESTLPPPPPAAKPADNAASAAPEAPAAPAAPKAPVAPAGGTILCGRSSEPHRSRSVGAIP